MRIVKYKYFFSWQNTLRFILAFIWVPLLLLFVTFPAWFFEKLQEFIGDNMPYCLKVDDNPEWAKMDNIQRRDFVNTLKDWE